MRTFSAVVAAVVVALVAAVCWVPRCEAGWTCEGGTCRRMPDAAPSVPVFAAPRYSATVYPSSTVRVYSATYGPCPPCVSYSYAAPVIYHAPVYTAPRRPFRAGFRFGFGY